MIDKQAYPVNLIQIIRLQDDAANNTCARSGLHHHFGLSEEEVEVGVNGRCVALLSDSELGALWANGNFACSDFSLIQS